MMAHFIFGTVWGWVGTAGVIVIACAAIGYLIPQARIYVIAIALAAASVAAAFTKGWLGRGKKEQEKRDAAVKKVGGEYDKIEARTDANRARDRLRDNSF